ncbi:MAG: TolC family protein [Deltaproteobacteria bacterium]|nr:TolC family protein [Deltaproteobacteria bacterium]
MRLRIVLAAAMAWLPAIPVWAETIPPTYDLATCIREALVNSPDLHAAAAEIAAARAQLHEAQAGRWGEAEYNQILSAVPKAEGNIVNSPQNRNALLEGLGPFTRLDLSINIPLWTFGKLSSALEAAQRGLESQQAGGEAKRADVIFDVKQLYYGLALTQQLSFVLHDMLDNMDKAVGKTKQRLDAGSKTVSEIDLLKLRTGRAKFAKGVAEVDAAATLARAALARAIGKEVNAPLQIAERRLQPVDARVDALDTYLAEAADHRPEARQIASGVAAQSAKVNLEEAGLYPSFFLTTGFQYAVAPNRTTQKNPFAYEDFNYTRPVGAFGLHWDINFFRTRAKVEQARADLDRLRSQQRGATSGLQLEVEKAYSELVQARDTMKASEDGHSAGRALLVLTVSNFDLGIGEAEELFKGLGSYTEASTDYYRAVHDYNLAIASLSKAVGKELAKLEY